MARNRNRHNQPPTTPEEGPAYGFRSDIAEQAAEIVDSIDADAAANPSLADRLFAMGDADAIQVDATPDGGPSSTDIANLLEDFEPSTTSVPAESHTPEPANDEAGPDSISTETIPAVDDIAHKESPIVEIAKEVEPVRIAVVENANSSDDSTNTPLEIPAEKYPPITRSAEFEDAMVAAAPDTYVRLADRLTPETAEALKADIRVRRDELAATREALNNEPESREKREKVVAYEAKLATWFDDIGKVALYSRAVKAAETEQSADDKHEMTADDIAKIKIAVAEIRGSNQTEAEKVAAADALFDDIDLDSPHYNQIHDLALAAAKGEYPDAKYVDWKFDNIMNSDGLESSPEVVDTLVSRWKFNRAQRNKERAKSHERDRRGRKMGKVAIAAAAVGMVAFSFGAAKYVPQIATSLSSSGASAVVEMKSVGDDPANIRDLQLADLDTLPVSDVPPSDTPATADALNGAFEAATTPQSLGLDTYMTPNGANWTQIANQMGIAPETLVQNAGQQLVDAGAAYWESGDLRVMSPGGLSQQAQEILASIV